jgi:putative ABC transport system permease protein
MFMNTFIQDLKLGLRVLAKSPWSTGIVVLTLALGVGVVTSIFSAVDGILLEPLPYTDSSRLVKVQSLTPYSGSIDDAVGVSLPTIQDIRKQCPAFEEVATISAYTGAKIQGDFAPDLVSAPKISGDFFSLLGAKPLLGRPIMSSDSMPGNERVTVLNYELWRERFGSNLDVVGTRITIDGEQYTIIGVMPAEFVLGTNARGLWRPFVPGPQDSVDRDVRDNFLVAKLSRHTSLDEANVQLNTLAERLISAYPEHERGWRLIARSVKEEVVGPVVRSLVLLFAAVGCVLLIASVNISGLLVTGGWARRSETAIRQALGAGRLRICQQFIAEAVLLVLVGGTLGLLISVWGVHILRVIAPPTVPRIDQLKLNATVLGFAIFISILEVILFGLAPAIPTMNRESTTLKENLSVSSSRVLTGSPQRLRSIFVIFEITTAVILAVSATLVARSFEKLVNVDLGYRTENIMTMSVLLSDEVCTHEKPETCRMSLEEILRRLGSLPGVYGVAASSIRPLGGQMVTPTLYVEAKDGIGEVALVQFRDVTSDFFSVVGVPLLAGRTFRTSDTKGSQPVAIVNSSFRKKYLLGTSIGKRVAIDKDANGKPQWMLIIGEVSDSRNVELKSEPQPEFFLPVSQTGFFGGSLLMRTANNPISLSEAIREQISYVDKGAPVVGVKTLDQVVEEKLSEPKFQTMLFIAFAIFALGLALLGMFGLMSTSVVQRKREIGIRMGLGAQPKDILTMLVREGMQLALLGIGLGVVCALLLTGFLRTLLFEVKPTDPVTFIGIVALFTVVAFVACIVPARHAIASDPAIALRYE